MVSEVRLVDINYHTATVRFVNGMLLHSLNYLHQKVIILSLIT